MSKFFKKLIMKIHLIYDKDFTYRVDADLYCDLCKDDQASYYHHRTEDFLCEKCIDKYLDMLHCVHCVSYSRRQASNMTYPCKLHPFYYRNKEGKCEDYEDKYFIRF